MEDEQQAVMILNFFVHALTAECILACQRARVALNADRARTILEAILPEGGPPIDQLVPLVIRNVERLDAASSALEPH